MHAVETGEQIRVALQEALADRVPLQAQLHEMRRQLEELMIENERLEAELNELKQAPFKPKRRRENADQTETEDKRKRRGREDVWWTHRTGQILMDS